MKSIWPKQALRPFSSLLWFWVSFLFFLPLHVAAVVLDPWFMLPPKPIGDGPDYEAIGYGLSQGHGWSTSFSDPQWRRAYEAVQNDETGPDYFVQLARRGPVVADTNRPPLLPWCIATAYRFTPRGPIAFGCIRIGLAVCLSAGCAMAVAWGVAIANSLNVGQSNCFAMSVGISLIAIVYSERNVRNYTTDFLTEPLALFLTQAFLVVSWYGSKSRGWRWAAASGALFAGMYFCRGVFVLWTPLVILWLGYLIATAQGNELGKGTGLSPARWMVVFLLAFCFIASAWWGRNCVVLGSFHPLGTKGGTTLLGGYCEEAYLARGEWQFGPEKAIRLELESKIDLETATAAELQNLEIEMGSVATEQVKHWLSQNLNLLPALAVNRVVTEWNPYGGKALVLKLFALWGCLWLFRCDRSALVWLAGPLAINTTLVAATYSVGGRFLVPTYGCIYILAAFGISGTLDFLWRAWPRR